ncbi:hypothetical protein ACFL6I_16120 [candidate division KSB1 bacterium]
MLSYNRDNNIFFWSGSAAVRGQVGNGLFSIVNDFDINRITAVKSGDKWKDNNQLDAELAYPFFDMMIPVFKVHSTYFADRQSGFLNNITENSISTEVPLNIGRVAALKPVVGYKWDKRIASPDDGVMQGLDAELYETRIGEYFGRVQGFLRNEKLDERVNRSQNLSVIVNRSFSVNAADTLSFNINRLRRDYYISATGGLESRRESIKRLANNLKYNLSEWGSVHIQAHVSSRDVDFSAITGDMNGSLRSRNELQTYLNMVTNIDLGRQRGALYIKYERNDQEHDTVTGMDVVYGMVPFDTRDNEGLVVELGGRLSGNVGRSHGYSVESFIEKFQYNTPSESNNDDHDQLRFGVKGAYSYMLSPTLILEVNSFVDLNHLVYIYQERSADNNWNRIIQAGTGVVYAQPSGVTVSGKYSVLANYVDYDFDDRFAQIRSFIFRRFSMDYNVTYPFRQKGEFHANLQVSMEENGLLQWDQFLQNRIIARKIAVGNLQYAYRWTENCTLTPGFTFFRRFETQNQATFSGLSRRLSSIRDNGVTLTVEYRVTPSAQIHLHAARRFINRGVEKEEFRYIDLSINWLF